MMKPMSRCMCEDDLITPIQSRSISDNRNKPEKPADSPIIQIQPRSKLTQKLKSQQSPISHIIQGPLKQSTDVKLYIAQTKR